VEALHDTYFPARVFDVNASMQGHFIWLLSIDNNDNWSYVGILNLFQKVIKTYF
jgi:hypothetical protein